MKCWICGKEESNADVKINVEYLIGTVVEYFNSEETYNQFSKKKIWYKRTAEEQAQVSHYSEQRDAGYYKIRDICQILNFDLDRLYTIAKLARKWEENHNWELCFPASDHMAAIVKYVTNQVNL